MKENPKKKKNKKIDSSNNEKPFSVEDLETHNQQGFSEIYHKLWENRKFELEHLWQRSIFLATFLVLIFTGYGFIMLKISDSIDLNDNPSNKLLFLNICGLAITFLGICLSTLWIAMGKGSKAWYERYQKALKALEGIMGSGSVITTKGNQNIGVFNCQLLPGYDSDAIDNSLFSTSGGYFSCSRINIAIGQVCLIAWTIAFAMHLIYILINYTIPTCIGDVLSPNSGFFIFLISTIVILFFLLLFFAFFYSIKKKEWIESRILLKQMKSNKPK